MPTNFQNPRTATSSSTPQVARNHAGTHDYGWVAQLPQDDITPNVFIFRQDVVSKATQTFDLSTIVNNPFNMPLQGDGHFTMTVISDSNSPERVHVVGNIHADPLDGPALQRHYGYTTWPPNTSSSWTFPAWSSLPFASTGGINAHTYFRWSRNTNGDIIAFQDQENSVATEPEFSTIYHRFWMLMVLPAGQSTGWYFPGGITKVISGTPGVGTGGPNRSYGNMTLVGDRVHVPFWFADVTEATSNWYRQGHSYIYSDPPYTTWKAVDGTTMTTPVTYPTRTACAITAASSQQGLNMVPIAAIDSNNYPYICYDSVDAAGVFNNPKYYQFNYNGTSWQANAVTQAGTSWPGMLYWNNLQWQMTNGFDRVRIRVPGGNAFNIGGAADRNMCPYPCPISVRDRANPRFLIPDGNNPMVYELGSKSNPRP